MIFKKYQNFWIFFIFLVLAFGFFGVTLNDFFVSDDFDFLFIAKNTKNVFTYFLTNYWGERGGGVYSPFLNLIFYFEYKVWHLIPFGYHLTNLLFHVGSSFFVFLICLELCNSGSGNKIFSLRNSPAPDSIGGAGLGALRPKNDQSAEPWLIQSSLRKFYFLRAKQVYAAFLAGFLFLIFPAHAEAVNWIAGRPHVIGTFFYLVAVWSYLKFRKSSKLKFIPTPLSTRGKLYSFWYEKKVWGFILIAFGAFIFSLLTKELALTLPFVLLSLELINLKFKEFQLNKNGRWIGILFALSAIYIFIRYAITNIFFGYYGVGSFSLKISQIFKTFTNGITGLVSWGSVRLYLNNFFWEYKILFLFLIFLLALFVWSRRKKQQIFSWDFLSGLILFVIPFSLVLFLQFSPISDEGERYLYLPSAGFCLLASFLLLKIFKKRFWLAVSVLAVVIYFSFFLISKNLIWDKASQISQKIVNDFGEVVDVRRQNTGLIFFSLPDNYEGAQVFRNGIKLAVGLYYPDYHPDPVILVPIYLRLDKFNKDDKIINWEMSKNCDYVFGASRDGGGEITGFDRKETEDFVFELWGYNYENYTSNAVKLKIKEGVKELMKDKKMYFLVYNEGELRKFGWCQENL